MKASDLDKNLKIRVQHLCNNEVIELELSAEAKDRYAELARVLKPFNLYFLDDDRLAEFSPYDEEDPSPKTIAELISSSDDLTVWLEKDLDLLSLGCKFCSDGCYECSDLDISDFK